MQTTIVQPAPPPPPLLGPRTHRVMSYLTDDNDVTLVRPLPRRDLLVKLSSAWSADDGMRAAHLHLHTAARGSTRPPGGAPDGAPSPRARRRAALHALQHRAPDHDDDLPFLSDILSGLPRERPPRATAVLRHRTHATMRGGARSPAAPLPRSLGAIRLRVEHITQTRGWRPTGSARRGQGSRGENDASSSSSGSAPAAPSPPTATTPPPAPVPDQYAICAIIRNALIADLADLSAAARSIRTRRFDVGPSDVHALFAFAAPLEAALRGWLAAAERNMHGGVAAARARADGHRSGTGSGSGSNSGDTPGSGSGSGSGRGDGDGDGDCEDAWVWDTSERRRRKQRVAELCDAVEAMRRRMLALGERCGSAADELYARVERLRVAASSVLDAEERVVGRIVHAALAGRSGQQVAVCACVVRELRAGPLGRDMVLLLSRGVGSDEATDGGAARDRWVREVGRVGRRFGAGGAVGRFDERHVAYVEMFVQAEAEYCALYERLGRGVGIGA